MLEAFNDGLAVERGAQVLQADCCHLSRGETGTVAAAGSACRLCRKRRCWRSKSLLSVVMTAMFSALSIVRDREFGFLREMLVAPVSRTSLVLGKTVGGATVAAAQGTIMLVLAPLVGIHLTPILVVEMIALELLMAVAMTTFGVFVASRIQKMESFQVVMQMLLMPMLFLSGALFPLNGLPGWLTVITRLNPLTYAVAPFRQVVFSAQDMSAAARARFPTNVTLFGYSLPIWVELTIVVVFALVFFVLAFRGLSRTE